MEGDKDINRLIQELKTAQKSIRKKVSALTEIVETQADELKLIKEALS